MATYNAIERTSDLPSGGLYRLTQCTTLDEVTQIAGPESWVYRSKVLPCYYVFTKVFES